MPPSFRAPAIALLALALVAPQATAQASSGDPLRDRQWALELIRAPEAWATTTGAGARLAVLDTGVDRSHPDLVVADGITTGGCPDDPDGCGDGDWTGARPRPPEDFPGQHLYHDLFYGALELAGMGGDDVATHGTLVAGIAAARRGNGVGVAGVAPDADLLAVNVDGGEEDRALAAGIRWAVAKGAHVINLSLSYGAEERDAAIREAIAAGVVVVVSAGNGNVAALPVDPGTSEVLDCFGPAALPGVLCVMATGPDGRPAPYSNGPGKSDRLVVAAPGGLTDPATAAAGVGCAAQIVTTAPAGHHLPCDDSTGLPDGYSRFSGTSAAAPHVAGLAALLAAQCRAPAEIVDVILRTAVQPGGERGVWSDELGYGLIDAAAAVAEPVVDRRQGC